MKTLNELFRSVILANELSNNLRAALRFSDPDGKLSGKSGWSFGVAQFDTQNNPRALDCLRECGFSSEEIHGIVHQTIADMTPLSARLAAHADVIARYDESQLTYCLNRAMNFSIDHRILVQSPGGVLAVADYNNQYGSMGEGAAEYFAGLGHPVTAEDVLNFKLGQTKYGKEHPADCRRRYSNIAMILKQEGLWVAG